LVLGSFDDEEITMTNPSVLPGIESQMIATPRLRQHVLTAGPANGAPVIFIHGNASSATFWEETMLALPSDYRGLAPDLRGYGLTEAQPIDATRGARNWTDDLAALLDALGLERAHLVAWSLGGAVAMQFAIDHPARVRSLTLQAPVSPYGFGGTKDLRGTPCYPDFAGSGGGTVNPDFVARMQAGDRSEEAQTSPRVVMNTFYYKPTFRAAREEDFLSSLLLERTGVGFYPGGMVGSENWPTVAPGDDGPINATSPRYFDVSGFADITPRPPVLWVRGADDQIVSDSSLFEFGTLGQLGAVPGWPGAEIFPPQPMIGQTRAVLESYQANGGRYREVVFENCGHAPHIEHPERFNALLAEHLQGN
jgi:pimeloyl-ACP methyl ester carboxylesterase